MKVVDSPPGTTSPSSASSCPGFRTSTTSTPRRRSMAACSRKFPCTASTPTLIDTSVVSGLSGADRRVEPSHCRSHDAGEPPASPQREQRAIERRGALHLRREAHERSAGGRLDLPPHDAVRSAADLRYAAKDRRRFRRDHARAGGTRNPQRSPDSHDAALLTHLVELEKVRFEPPVVAQVREELEDHVRRVRHLPRRADLAVYQPRVSRSSSGRSVAVESPLIASPRPRDTRPRIWASL